MTDNPYLRFSDLLANPDNSSPTDAEVANLYVGRLPAWITDIWKRFGIGSYRNGYCWFCLPGDFDDVLLEIFASFTELNAENYAVFGYTSDSILYLVDRQGRLYWVYMNISYIISFRSDDNEEVLQGRIATGIMAATKWIDDDLQMHSADIDSLGRLNKGEIFGFVPALQLGGAPRLANVRKMRAAEHWSFLAQLQPLSF